MSLGDVFGPVTLGKSWSVNFSRDPGVRPTGYAQAEKEVPLTTILSAYGPALAEVTEWLAAHPDDQIEGATMPEAPQMILQGSAVNPRLQCFTCLSTFSLPQPMGRPAWPGLADLYMLADKHHCSIEPEPPADTSWTSMTDVRKDKPPGAKPITPSKIGVKVWTPGFSMPDNYANGAEAVVDDGTLVIRTLDSNRVAIYPAGQWTKVEIG